MFPSGHIHAQSALETAISHLQYRELGPALMGGRIADIAVVESKPQIFYIGTGTGGVWKTENHGTSWTPLFDDQPTSSIGDVTLDQSNPNLVWVGTGEPQNRQSSGWGNGVYKSVDGGRTWRHMGLEGSKHVGRILIHPRDPDIVYVAAVGDLWGPNEERGSLPHAGWGRELGEGPLHRRGHRCHRHGDGPARSQHHLRGDVPAAPHGLGLQRGRPGERALPHPGRGRHMDGTDRGTPRWR